MSATGEDGRCTCGHTWGAHHDGAGRRGTCLTLCGCRGFIGKSSVAAAIGGDVGGMRQKNGSWLCSCGKSCPTDLALFSHRRHEAPHIGREVQS